MHSFSFTIIFISLISNFYTTWVLARDPDGERIDLSDLQGTWSVEEYFPKPGGGVVAAPNTGNVEGGNRGSTSSSFASSLACESNLDVTFEITGNIWRRQSTNSDRFNSNGKYYILQAVKGNEMNYVKFRVFQDLVTEINPCIGYVREGKILRIQMNATDFTNCPNQPDEYAGVCNKWIFTTATCTGGRCLTGGGTQQKTKVGTGGENSEDGESNEAYYITKNISLACLFILMSLFLTIFSMNHL